MTWGRLFGNPVAVLAVVVVALAIFAPNLLAQIFTQAVVGIAGAVTPLIGCIFLFGIFALIARGLFTGKWK